MPPYTAGNAPSDAVPDTLSPQPASLRPSPLRTGELWGFLFLAFALILLRTPRLLTEGRVWAEEGTNYLRYAWNAPPLTALLAPHQGYYSLWDNALGLVAARLLPLRFAALLFTWAALALQLLTVYLAVSSQWARSSGARLLALLALVLTSASKEVWLNMENCQFWFPVCVALLLVRPALRLHVPRLLFLALAGLTGVTSCMLTPLFWVRAALARTRPALVEAGLLTLTSLLQFGAILYSVHAGFRQTERPLYAYLGPILLQRVWILPFLTTSGANASNHLFLHHGGAVALLLAWVVFLLLSFAALFALFRQSTALGLLLSAGLLTAVLNWTGCFHADYRLWSQSSIYDSRYFFEADALLNLSVAYAVFAARTARGRGLAAAVLLVLLLSGASQYMRGRDFFTNYQAWAPQVRQWQADPSLGIAAAPAPGHWIVHLPLRHPDLQLPAGVYDSTRAGGSTR